jgi:alcohol dehydrogenase (quinone), cytochrome c subunit
MPPQSQLTDEEIASVLSYVRSTFGNHGEPVRPEEVTRMRSGKPLANR